MVIFVLLTIFFLQMYRIYKAVYDITTEQNKTWEECCLRVPVVNIDKMIEEELEGKRRRREADDEWDFSDFEQEEFVEKTDMSVDNYPQVGQLSSSRNLRRPCEELINILKQLSPALLWQSG